ncbi:hypothetical protein [Rhizobium herbae]
MQHIVIIVIFLQKIDTLECPHRAHAFVIDDEIPEFGPAGTEQLPTATADALNFSYFEAKPKWRGLRRAFPPSIL